MTLDTWWPGGYGTQSRLLGRCRDLLTPLDGGPPRVLVEDVLRVGALDRVIEDITSEPSRPALAGLVGARGGGHLRRALVETVPAERAAGTPLYLMLDDLSGATLVGAFAFGPWRETGRGIPPGTNPRRRMEGVCIGFRPGSSALEAGGTARPSLGLRQVESVADPADPIGWHRLEDVAEISARRSRRLDVYLDGAPGTAPLVRVDAFFQDSAPTPEGHRVAVHEYRLDATVDPVSGTLVQVSADPRVLPYRECPLATVNIEELVGTPVVDLRETVLERLRGTLGCTHLNDALRALAEVPTLMAPLLTAA
jgi:hypothetical protein